MQASFVSSIQSTSFDCASLSEQTNLVSSSQASLFEKSNRRPQSSLCPLLRGILNEKETNYLTYSACRAIRRLQSAAVAQGTLEILEVKADIVSESPFADGYQSCHERRRSPVVINAHDV